MTLHYLADDDCPSRDLLALMWANAREMNARQVRALLSMSPYRGLFNAEYVLRALGLPTYRAGQRKEARKWGG